MPYKFGNGKTRAFICNPEKPKKSQNANFPKKEGTGNFSVKARYTY